MPRTTSFAVAMLAGVAALSALPVLAADAAAKPAAIQPAATQGSEKLSQALSHLSAADGFELRGLDKVGDETVQAPKSVSTVKALRKMLTGYAYTVEFAPADPTGKAPRKLSRVSILGRSNDVAGEAAPPATAGAAATAEASSAPAGDAAAQPTHPVTRMLQSLARATIPPLAQPAGQTNETGVPGAVSATPAGGSTPAASSSSSPSAASVGGGPSQTDMATLTQQASAGVGALVQSLKAACPAGSKC